MLVTCAVVAALIQLGGSGAAVTATPDQVGQWTAPVSWPMVAVHMSLEPTGQVWISDAWDNAPNNQRLWNPSTGTFTSVPYGRNLFCAGHVQLPDGRTLIVGGNIGGDNGLADTTIFNPSNDTYFRGPDMTVGRWYPTATVLPDGRVLAFSGDNIAQDRPGQPHPFEDASINSLPSIYNPKTNTWGDLTSAALTSPLYPYMFVLSDGRVLDAGPDTTTRILDPATSTWTTVGTSPFDGMSAVMYRPNKIMKAGAWADPDFNGAKVYNSSAQTAVIDMNAGSPAWRSTAPMSFPRSYQNMTLLPDGTVLASGGMTDSDGTDLSKGVLPAEIWNPDTETWTTVASLTNPREYHSTALLLPDGRVLMAGGGGLPGRATDETNAEIYSPPYLFKGARPTITTVPSSAAYGASFDVTTPNAASIAHVSLIRSPSVTHAFDQNQRFQFLNFTAGSGKVTVTAPANANLAPPGDYLLFLVDNNGVPSTGSFVRISASGDVTPPTAPSNVTATATPGQVALSWTASTDASGIASYSVYRSTTSGFTPSTANRIAQPTGTSYTDVGLTGGTYYYKITADDNAGNTSTPSSEVTAVVPSGPPPGRVGAWGFDEGSGTTVADASGNNNTGTLTNATWAAAGKFGKALSFNGTNAYVNIPDSNSLDLTTGLTVEGWVNPSVAGGGFRTLLVKERPGDLVYGLYANSDTNRPQSQVTVGSTAKLLDGAAAIPTGTWTHLAFTFDGTTERLYVNGTQVSSVATSGSILTSSSPVKIGGNAIWGEWFNGMIDEVRVYNRALSAGEIQTDMNAPIAPSDTTPPSAPGVLSATGGLGQVSLSWGAATDNTGVAKYDVYRSTTSGFTPSTANRIAQPAGTTYTDSGLAAGTYYYKVTAEDGAGNVGPPGNEASGTATADTTPPSAPTGLVASASAAQVSLTWGASTDAGGIARYAVYRSTTSGFTPSTANRIAQPTATSYTDTGLSAGTYYYKVTADDNAGNTSSPSNEASATVTAAPPGGLVAAYGFDAGSGTTVADQSGNGNNGTLTNATWAGASAGKFGNALSFNGSNASVSVPDANSLDLTSGMTLEGWVNPSVAGGGFRTLVVKERPGDLVYGLYANSDTNKPQSQVTIGGAAKLLDGTAAIPTGAWTHLAATFDGTTERLYVNGTQVSSVAISGSILTSTNPLKIGGNAIWGEWFNGLIDEVRVYSRALSASEIQGDMNVPISSADSIPPSTPGTLSATGGFGQASLSWGASTDNVGVAKYDVYRSTVAGFIPSASNRIAQPTGTTYTDTGLAAGVYFYKVAAEDAAGNLSSPSNESSATVTGDTTPPTAPGSLAASVAGSTANLTWTAATDNVGVARYDVYRSTTSGFTPSAGNRIAQPTGTSYNDAGLTTGTYYYKVAAEDAAGNIGPPSAEATAIIGDTSPPTAPGSLTANVVGTSVGLTWTASTDNIGVVRYNVHRGTTSGFTPSAANRIAQPTGLNYTDSSLPAGTFFYKVTAEDAAGNISAVSNTATATITDTSPPTTPGNFTATGGAGQAVLSWTASTDNVAVAKYDVYRSTVAGFIPSTSNRIAQPTVTTYTDVVGPGTYFYKVAAEDAAGNLSSPSTEASATVTQGSSGLVAAYGFDAGTGTTTADQSGAGNTGTLTNATWAGAGNGKFGNALSFNGTNSYVSVADSNSLDLTNGMTLEAWVKPNSVGGFRTVVVKERPGDLAYGMYAGSDTSRPQSQVTIGSTARLLDGTASIPTGSWTHLAATYDGTTERLYVNGTQVSSLAVSGTILTSTSPLRIGGNTIWGEYFDGLIDEVRVYNRALSGTEIATDMNSSISAPDTVPPSAPGTLTATGGLGQASLNWGAASDNVGVTKYDVYRSTVSGFTPSVSNRIAQPTGASYVDSGLAAGTYYYEVAAEDAAGNVGPPSNEANAVSSTDTTPPSVSITAPSTGATVSGTVNVTANASDNGSVAAVQFKLDGSNLGAEDTAAPYSVSWDTFSSGNGAHTLSAVARDAAGNTASAGNVSVTVQNTAAAGLVGAWAFDEGTGTTVADQSGKNNNGTTTNTTWTSGKFNNALSFNGSNSWATVPDSSTLDLTTGMTVEAWVKPSTSGGTVWQTAVVKEQSGNLAYGIYENTNQGKPEAEVFVGGATHAVNGTSALPAGAWSHLAATYDGSTIKLYVNGALVSQATASGSIITSTLPLRIGGNNIWGERFSGTIDEVRVYNRALTAGEIQGDMVRSVTPDVTPPTLTAKTPAGNAAGVNVGNPVTATFSELMNTGSFSGNFTLKDASNTIVPTTVTYDSSTNIASLTPQNALQYGATYTATIKGGSGGVTDIAGNPLASDVTWSFTTESSPPQILVVGSSGNPFGLYVGEILRNEGLDAFTTIDVAFLTPALLSGFDVVILGDTALTPAQVTALTSWVNAGGNLVAMRPDKQLAGLLGLTDAGSTLANTYLKVDTTVPPGAGIVSATIQYHGTADRYTLNGATAVATLYSNATTATTNPAVTLRAVGSSGGQAAAFTYDLARSVVLTRQGNPAWIGQERDGVAGIRPDDMFYGAKSGDVQPDWIDTSKIAIPQADEQQRLLVNMVTLMERDKMPLPHFWYLPRGKKAVVVLSGDDHSPTQATGGTASIFDRFISQSPAGCVVSNWECIRATSYVYPNSALTSAQANSYVAQGFEVAFHPNVGSCPTTVQDEPTLSAQFDTQLAQFRTKYSGIPSPVSDRIHCVFWPGWLTSANVELSHGMRMDANYYHYPQAWIGAKPGFLNGGGFPMRFADTNGTILDVYQDNTNMDDEAGQVYPATVDALLDNAVGANGYYGAFGTNIHNDNLAPNANDDAIVASAQSRGVPLISYKQLLDWTDGRNASTIRSMNWSAGTFTFVTTVGAGANGLQTLLPTQGPTGTLHALSCGGSAKAYTLQTIKGIQYAMFDTITGTCQATYS